MHKAILVLFLISLLSACTPAPLTISIPTPSPSHLKSSSKIQSPGKCIDVRSPTPDPGEKSLFPPPDEKDHILGSNSANVTILIYSDFQCTSCAQIAPLLESFVVKYPDEVRLIFRNFPLIPIHDKSALAAQAAEAASLQGNFWQFHDLLFSRQKEWTGLTAIAFREWILEQTTTLQIDRERFEADLNSPPVKTKIQQAWDDGQKIKLPGAPVILIDGEIVKWQTNLLSQLETFIKLAILSKKQFNNCPPLVIDTSKHYFARLQTSKGEILIKLYEDESPNTVNNFVFLAEKGWFNNNIFHRVVSGSVVQTGDPSGTGFGGPGYFIPNERNNLLYDRAGMVGMVNNGPDTNGSQFLITLTPAANFNQDYTIFGEVVSGLDILEKFLPQDPSDNNSTSEPEKLISVSIDVK